MSKLTVPQVMPLVAKVYKRHGVGCCLHMVVDDGNVKQSDIDYCLNYALERKHPDCIEAAEMLARMTKTQRNKVATTIYQYMRDKWLIS